MIKNIYKLSHKISSSKEGETGGSIAPKFMLHSQKKISDSKDQTINQ